MALLKYQAIERGILTLALHGDAEQGYPTSMTDLQNVLRASLEDVGPREIIGCLRTLHERKQVELWKWQGDWVKFVQGRKDDFFWSAQFNIRATPGTDRRLQLLEAKEEKVGKQMAQKEASASAQASPLISENRLNELRALNSAKFDFKKLIRLCEEININYREGCYFGTAMLTRALLDHVPPVFCMGNFGLVASNYGARSFKGTMQHLDSGARNIADGHLHGQIRKKETLPEPQQVDFRNGLDALLAEIVRITQETDA